MVDFFGVFCPFLVFFLVFQDPRSLLKFFRFGFVFSPLPGRFLDAFSPAPCEYLMLRYPVCFFAPFQTALRFIWAFS